MTDDQNDDPDVGFDAFGYDSAAEPGILVHDTTLSFMRLSDTLEQFVGLDISYVGGRKHMKCALTPTLAEELAWKLIDGAQRVRERELSPSPSGLPPSVRIVFVDDGDGDDS